MTINPNDCFGDIQSSTNKILAIKEAIVSMIITFSSFPIKIIDVIKKIIENIFNKIIDKFNNMRTIINNILIYIIKKSIIFISLIILILISFVLFFVINKKIPLLIPIILGCALFIFYSKISKDEEMKIFMKDEVKKLTPSSVKKAIEKTINKEIGLNFCPVNWKYRGKNDCIAPKSYNNSKCKNKNGFYKRTLTNFNGYNDEQKQKWGIECGATWSN